MVNKGYASHQYASDVGWASKQTYELSQMYSRLSTYSLAFDIPNYVGDSTDLYIVKPGTGTLRIRASYSTSSTVLRTVNDNDYVAVVLSKGKPVSKVSGGYTWYEVSLGAQNGWVASEYLKKP
jgi:mannosyl-glycoprotein endo-beta-N-acetylglucosaminidase